MASLALNSHVGEAFHTKAFYSPETQHDKGLLYFIDIYCVILAIMEDRNLSQVAQNPFAGLFPSAEKAEEYRKQHDSSVASLQSVEKHNADTVMQTQPITVSMKEIRDDNLSNESEHVDVEELNEKDRAWMLNDLLQRVFLITVDNGNIFVL